MSYNAGCEKERSSREPTGAVVLIAVDWHRDLALVVSEIPTFHHYISCMILPKGGLFEEENGGGAVVADAVIFVLAGCFGCWLGGMVYICNVYGSVSFPGGFFPVSVAGVRGRSVGGRSSFSQLLGVYDCCACPV